MIEIDMTRYKEDLEKTEHKEEGRNRLSLYKSKFSLSEAVTEILGSLRTDISHHASKVESGLASNKDVKTLIGLLNETWSHIQHMNGLYDKTRVKRHKRSCKAIINKYGDGNIPETELEKILSYRNSLYRILAFNNLSIEIESKRTSNKLKERIIG